MGRKLACALLLLTTLAGCSSEADSHPPRINCEEGCGPESMVGGSAVLVPPAARGPGPTETEIVIEAPTRGVANPGLTNLGGGTPAGLWLGNNAGGPGVGPTGGAGTTGAGGVGGSAAGGGSAGGTGGSAAGGGVGATPRAAGVGTTPGAAGGSSAGIAAGTAGVGAGPMAEPGFVPP